MRKLRVDSNKNLKYIKINPKNALNIFKEYLLK